MTKRSIAPARHQVDIVMSHWSAPRGSMKDASARSLGFASEALARRAAVLAARLASRYAGPVTLYACEESQWLADLLAPHVREVRMLRVPNAVSPAWWMAGKLAAIRQHASRTPRGRGLLHLDLDFFLLAPLPASVRRAPLAAQSAEPAEMHAYYARRFGGFGDQAAREVSRWPGGAGERAERLIRLAASGEGVNRHEGGAARRALNAGLVGGRRLDVLVRWASAALATCERFEPASGRDGLIDVCLAEQWLFEVAARAHGIRPALMLPILRYIEEPSTWRHLIGESKQTGYAERFVAQVEARLQQAERREGAR
jgi:hypothetical protein